ncbi:peptidase M24, structural domain-containing protein [Paraphysoderma sedebokerense]|nr:peptidase M24, structural domain-containing protein [Paraphysoderma sedebokerense]
MQSALCLRCLRTSLNASITKLPSSNLYKARIGSWSVKYLSIRGISSSASPSTDFAHSMTPTAASCSIPSQSNANSPTSAHSHSPFSQIGQPHHSTHPHILKDSELTGGITVEEYESRRQRLMENVDSGGKVVIFGNPVCFSTNKIFYPFHQNTDFFYLTGFNEPDSVLVLEKRDSLPRKYKMTLFVPYKTPEEVTWTGHFAGPDNAIQIFRADESYPTEHFHNFFSQLIHEVQVQKSTLYIEAPPIVHSTNLYPTHMTLSHSSSPTTHTWKNRTGVLESVKEWFKDGNSGWSWQGNQHRGLGSGKSKMEFDGLSVRQVKRISPLIQELRLVKSEAEATVMKSGGEISGRAFQELMRRTPTLDTEHQVANYFEYQIRHNGSTGCAYVPVVASGSNALVLHYVQNNMVLNKGDMVLVDAGGEYNHYASDITRTFPTSGKFSEPQKELYRAVLKVQRKCIELCTARSNLSLDQIHDFSTDMLYEELKLLGFTCPKSDVSNVLYIHHIGHYLGLDVHDTPDISRSRKLQSGMVVTIEPGLYVPPSPSFPSRYHNIGIRIEDNILVRDNFFVNLSSNAPKEVEDIEALFVEYGRLDWDSITAGEFQCFRM